MVWDIKTGTVATYHNGPLTINHRTCMLAGKDPPTRARSWCSTAPPSPDPPLVRHRSRSRRTVRAGCAPYDPRTAYHCRAFGRRTRTRGAGVG